MQRFLTIPSLSLLILPIFLNGLEWKEWEMESGFRRMRPWTCCSVCPDENTIYFRGRCVDQSFVNNSRPLTQTDLYIRDYTPVYITRLEACCYFCGKTPNSYMLSCTDPDRMSQGCPLEMLYCKHNIESENLLLNSPLTLADNSLTSTLSCYSCIGVISFINELKSLI